MRVLSLSLMGWILAMHVYAHSPQDTILNHALDAIRADKAQLRLFFRQMPKGADLHHHYSGAVFDEISIDALWQHNLYIHPQTLAVKEKLTYTDSNFIRVNKLSPDEWEHIRTGLLRKWSVREFDARQHRQTNADFFFSTFGAKGPTEKIAVLAGLLSLKKQALAENVAYIETMLHLIPTPTIDAAVAARFDRLWRAAEQQKDTAAVFRLFDSAYHILMQAGAKELASTYTRTVNQRHESLRLDDNFFTMRYQNYALRTLNPFGVFTQLVGAFVSASESPYIVGVNLVGPEHHSVALQDYLLHMHMFAYLRKKFPPINCSLHAGELTANLASPMQLQTHIHDAIHIGGARRIGHGVAISQEYHAERTLTYMATNQIAVEINLTSNEFILGVKNEDHPVRLYHTYRVPIVLGSDDAGVLRTDLTEQYVLLANRYPNFSYTDIKQLVFNTIRYSFLPENTRKRITTKLQQDFHIFEQNVLDSHAPSHHKNKT